MLERVNRIVQHTNYTQHPPFINQTIRHRFTSTHMWEIETTLTFIYKLAHTQSLTYSETFLHQLIHPHTLTLTTFTSQWVHMFLKFWRREVSLSSIPKLLNTRYFVEIDRVFNRWDVGHESDLFLGYEYIYIYFFFLRKFRATYRYDKKYRLLQLSLYNVDAWLIIHESFLFNPCIEILSPLGYQLLYVIHYLYDLYCQ